MKENENTTKNVIDYSLNERIKFLIEEKLNTTVYDFSKKIGNHRADGIYRIVKNEVSPTPKTLQKIFDAFPDYEFWLKNGETEEQLRVRLGGKNTNLNYNSEGEIPTVNEPVSTYGKKLDLEQIISALKILTESNQILVKSNSDLVRMLNSKL